MPKSRIMYIEDKSSGLVGPARIGRVTFSKRGRTIRYAGREFASIGRGFNKSNYLCIESRAWFWISGPRKDGNDGLYGYRPTPIDHDAREEYWRTIRGCPESKDRALT